MKTLNVIFLVIAFTFVSLIAISCKGGKNYVELPAPGTKATTESMEFKSLAQNIGSDCRAMGGCTCYLDGIQTSCALVFACLDAGFCELVKAE